MKRLLPLAAILIGCSSPPDQTTVYMFVQPDAASDVGADAATEDAVVEAPDVGVDGPDADSVQDVWEAGAEAQPEAAPDVVGDHIDEMETGASDAPEDVAADVPDEPPVCGLGTWRCDGDALQLCDGAGWGAVMMCQPGLCDSTGHQCDVCVAGASACAGLHATVWCSSDGQSESTADCPSYIPWCGASGKCVECSEDAHCAPPTSDCQNAVCMSGACALQPKAAGIVCQNGTGKCDGAGHCAVCVQGEKRCSGSYPETCGPTGQWEAQLQCVGFTPHCVDGECRACLGTAGPSMVRTPLGYCVDSTEVTRDQYQLWLATNPSPAGQPTGCDANDSFVPDVACMADSSVCQGATCGTHPQVCVDWCDARAYCLTAGKRLCGHVGGGTNPYMGSDGTSEWVQACSSGGMHAYPYGDVFVISACTGGGPVWSVPSKMTCQSSEPGWSGVFDMSGNVAEWEDACDNANNICRVRGCSVGCNQQALACTATFSGSSRLSTHNARGFRCCAD